MKSCSSSWDIYTLYLKQPSKIIVIKKNMSKNNELKKWTRFVWKLLIIEKYLTNSYTNCRKSHTKSVACEDAAHFTPNQVSKGEKRLTLDTWRNFTTTFKSVTWLPDFSLCDVLLKTLYQPVILYSIKF